MIVLPPVDPPRQDMHVHSTFSDGANSIAENVAEAEARGLTELTCVDHVRRATDWVPAYVAAVEQARTETSLTLHCGIEAKLLDTSGALDLPADIAGVDRIYAADHQVPLADGPHNPRSVRAALEQGELDRDAVLDALLTSTANAVARHERVVIAHLFSVLPKLGLDERDVPLERIAMLADAAAAHGALIEVDERWRCPSARTVRPFVERGVPLLLSTDSHRRETIGRYEHCLSVVRELAAGATPATAG